MIRSIGGLNHFDSLMHVRIEGLAFGRNGSHAQLGQRILQLPIDEFHSAAEVGGVGCHLQRALEAVEDRQQRPDGICGGVVAEVLLLLGGAAAGVFKFGLRPRQAVEQRIAFGLQLL